MAKGKLSVTEKYAIQGMLHQHLSVEEIAEALERTPNTVQNYVDNELSSLQDTIAKAQLQAVEEEERPEIEVPEDMRAATLVRLKQNTGRDMHFCEEILNRTINKLTYLPENDHKLYVLCIRQLNAKDVMSTRSAGGRPGVTVMTGAASNRGDNMSFSDDGRSVTGRKVKDGKSRSSRGNVFRPKDNKMG